MENLPLLVYILWLIICTIILIFVYIIFALTLILVIISFLSLILFMSLFSNFIGGQVNVKLNSLTILKGEDFTTFKYEIGLESVPFFAFMVPTVYISFITQNSSYQFPFHFFTGSLDINKLSIFEDLQGDGVSQSSSLAMSSSNSEETCLEQFWNGVAIMITAVSIILSLTYTLLMVLNFLKEEIFLDNFFC
ncbi:MAG: hypothetical protein ACFFBI_05115 [Promethearchaeota archaeon]